MGEEQVEGVSILLNRFLGGSGNAFPLDDVGAEESPEAE